MGITASYHELEPLRGTYRAQWDTGLHRYSLPRAPLPPPLWRLILLSHATKCMRKEDVVGSLFSVITANGLCYSSVFTL